MQGKFLHALSVSVEWRVVAFVITNVFFLFTTRSFWEATGLALLLQAILFVTYTLWYFIRFEKAFPFSYGKTDSPKESHI